MQKKKLVYPHYIFSHIYITSTYYLFISYYYQKNIYYLKPKFHHKIQKNSLESLKKVWTTFERREGGGGNIGSLHKMLSLHMHKTFRSVISCYLCLTKICACFHVTIKVTIKQMAVTEVKFRINLILQAVDST